MDRRRFCKSAIGAAVAASVPTERVLASYLQALTTVAGDIDAISGDGAEVILKHADVQDLSNALRGRLLLPGNEGYDKARHVLNGGIDRYPALVVQPSGATDVGLAVDYARDNGLLLAVKCGGHSTSGKSTCDGGLQIDLSSYRNVEVDTSTRIAHVAGGSLLGDMDHETMSHGLVTTAGTVSHTGVGGLTTGGGFGRVARRFGLALDNVLAVDIVTADGQLRHADPKENADLYWGVRGGGGLSVEVVENKGVVGAGGADGGPRAVTAQGQHVIGLAVLWREPVHGLRVVGVECIAVDPLEGKP